MSRRLALVSVFLAPYAAGAADAAGASGATSTGPAAHYETLFKSPWNEDNNKHGLQHLEHVNVCIPSHDPAKHLYYDILGFAPDARRAHNIGKGSGTIWANIGSTQIHLPEGEPQVVPGTIGLVYGSSDLAEVIARLTENAITNGNENNRKNALEGTKFAWREEKEEGGEETGYVDVTCPYGNVYRLHKRKPSSSTIAPEATQAATTTDRGGGGGALDPRGGRLPNVPAGGQGSSSLGLGISYVSFRVRPGTAAGIARFYRELFGAEAQEMGGGGSGDGDGGGGSSSGEDVCSVTQEGDSGKGLRCSTATEADKRRGTAAVVRVGPVQHLAFVEEEDEALLQQEYDGHHICVYLPEEGFRRSFEEAERRGLVFVNPRRNFGKADTLEKALEEKQYRIKDLVDPATGELLHVLEHEIRSISHPSYPVARDLSAHTPM
ncbi:conserved unknown protein [Ectocarpus siliculosus]|uniref:VOC domain-containing protein n=1 Tax=Ectocarpus siliculosus TaxID=2880 RepID=D7G620_ECTSI|nr:conserved unknown protein [Ectocarpus siliculosus]|eukprot:CBJ27429.1 conserved unknown protein [Ectocarpus siliculosus]